MNQGENLAKKIYKNKKTVAVLAVIALVVVGGAAYIKVSQRSSGTDTTTQTHGTATKQYAQTSGEGGSAKATSQSSTGSNQAAANSLQAPTGQLLNKQTVSLSSTQPETDPNLESVCQTLQQATCDIDLTGSNNQIKTVGAKNTGSSGTVIFDWNAKALGLTPGKWTVQAVVVQNNQTGTSHSEYLEVQP